jgi:hypothetical protein
MKNLLLLIILAMSTFAYSQDVKISWEDSEGREFSITAPSGQFSYGMLSGDNISYNYDGKISKVGPVYISYTYDGNVSKVGSVYISYTYDGKVSKVGGLYVKYTYDGKVSGTSGRVN